MFVWTNHISGSIETKAFVLSLEVSRNASSCNRIEVRVGYASQYLTQGLRQTALTYGPASRVRQ